MLLSTIFFAVEKYFHIYYTMRQSIQRKYVILVVNRPKMNRKQAKKVSLIFADCFFFSSLSEPYKMSNQDHYCVCQCRNITSQAINVAVWSIKKAKYIYTKYPDLRPKSCDLFIFCFPPAQANYELLKKLPVSHEVQLRLAESSSPMRSLC